MRISPLVPVAMFVLMSGSAAAQGWVEYTSQQDRFIVNFPGQPVVREIPYPTEFGITLSARVYAVDDGPNRYSITVLESDARRVVSVKIVPVAGTNIST